MNGDTQGREGFRDPSGGIYKGWTTTLGSTVGLALGPSVLLVFCFGTFITPLHNEFGWSIASISLGAMMISVMIMLTSIVQGRLVDRLGGRTMVLIFAPLFGLGFAMLYFLPDRLWMFYAMCLLLPWLGLGVWPISYLKLTGAWFGRRLGLALGIANAGIGIGAAVLPPLAVHLIATYGWRSAYLVLGLLAMVIAWPTARWLLKDRKDAEASQAPGAPRLLEGMGFADARRTRSFWIIAIGFALLGAASMAIIVHQSRVLIDLGMTPQRAGALQASMGIALIFGRVCTGWLLDRFHARSIMLVLCLGGAVALSVLASGAPMNSAIACAVVIGFLVGAEFDVLSYVIPRYFGIRAFGTIYGAVFAVFQLFAAIGVATVGNSRSALGTYSTALWVLAAVLFLAACCFMLLKEYRYTHQGGIEEAKIPERLETAGA